MNSHYRPLRSGKWSLAAAVIVPMLLAAGVYVALDRPSIPVRGTSGQTGTVFTYYAQPVRGQKRRYGVAGGTYVSVVEFGPTVRRLAVNTMGASGDPTSKHFFDQAPLFARGQFRSAWFTLEEIKANLERQYRPGK